jgi:hypothetical protein
MTETITLIDTSDPRATEGMRQMVRKLWKDSRNVKLRRALKMPNQAQNYAWVAQNGADPLPEVLDPPMCTTCGENVGEPDYDGICGDCEAASVEDSSGPDA